jgi:hypothetical protein
MIAQYANNVFTHGGQSDVEGFGREVLQPGPRKALDAVTNLTVYIGYHGTRTGHYSHDFSSPDMTQAQKIGLVFTKATLVTRNTCGLTDLEITRAADRGNVFFTWCDSDTRVKDVMGKNMPTFVHKWV